MLVVSGFRTRVGKWDHGREHVGKLLTAEDAEVSQRARRKKLLTAKDAKTAQRAQTAQRKTNSQDLRPETRHLTPET
jgi:hypothetical protein